MEQPRAGACATNQPYDDEVQDLDRMIGAGAEKLTKAGTGRIRFQGVSVGSLRYIKAGLMFVIQKRQDNREAKAGDGWPDGALRSLDEEIERIDRISREIEQEPSAILWEAIPQEVDRPEYERMTTTDWDTFICHTSEDKEDIVRPLANGLESRGLTVWYDEFTLTVGDGLRRSIDRGLAHSRFGVVVLSPAFLRKEWPQLELDGLVAREVGGVKVILPVWHGIDEKELRKHSPMLADKVAVSSDTGLDHVIAELMRAIEGGTRTRDSDAPILNTKPGADVRVRLVEVGGKYRLVIENRGPEDAHDLHFDIDPEYADKSPLVSGDCKEKLPVEILRSGDRVELMAALSLSKGTTFRFKWSWTEDGGQLVERNEKVSLQTG